MVSLAGEEEAFSSFIEKDGWDDEGLSDDEIEMNEFDPFSQEETYSQREEEEEEEEEGGEIDEPLLQQNEKEEKEKENGEEEPPFPWFHLILVYGVLASDAMTFLIIQPLGPDQCVERFGMGDNPGLCSGILVGAFIFGVALAAIPLGHVADIFGRKGVMMLGLLTGGISAISYGLSSSFWVAFLLRFLGGITNANVVMTSAACADLTTGKQRVLAFAYLWGIFSISSAISGAFAGIFAEEERQPFTYQGNRFFFPLFIVGVINLVTLVLVFFFLPETNKFVGGEEKEGKDEEGRGGREGEEGENNGKEGMGMVDKIRLGFEVVAADKLQQLICVCYCLNAFGNSALLTVVVLYFQESIGKRGLGLEDLGYGIMLGIYSFIGIVFQLLCFKSLTVYLQTNYKIYFISMSLFILGCILSPFSVMPFLFGVSDTTKFITKGTTLLTLAPLSIAGMMGLSILSTMQSNITHPTRQGFSLGILQCTSCLARSLGPVTAGAIFDALSGNSLGSATFWACGVVYLSCLLLIRRMTEEDKWRTQESRFGEGGEEEKKFVEVEDEF